MKNETTTPIPGTPGNAQSSGDSANSQGGAPHTSEASEAPNSSPQAKAAGGYWSKYTPEQRSEIMRNRQAGRRKSKSKTKRAKVSDSLTGLWLYDRQQLVKQAKTLMRAHIAAAATLQTVIYLLKH